MLLQCAFESTPLLKSYSQVGVLQDTMDWEAQHHLGALIEFSYMHSWQTHVTHHPSIVLTTRREPDQPVFCRLMQR